MSSSEELSNWVSEQKCQKAVDALGKKGFTGILCRTRREALDYIINQAAEADSIGFGGSMTIAELNVVSKLEEMGKELLNQNLPGLSPEERSEILHRHATCDLYLTATNALTLTGCLVNIDATGNRVGSMGFGPRKVIVVAGRNKLVADVEGALKRIKEYASPANAKRLNYNTPCAKTGFCTDCSSPDRMCRITTILEYKPRLTDVRVLVVNEDMGL